MRHAYGDAAAGVARRDLESRYARRSRPVWHSADGHLQGRQEGSPPQSRRWPAFWPPYRRGTHLIPLLWADPTPRFPVFVARVLAKYPAVFGRYPIAKGIEPFRRAAANWLSSRFDLPRGIDPESEILVLNGSREGLFFAAITAARYVGERRGRPAILMPNPFYPAYAAGARAAGCEQLYLPTT